VSFQQKWLGVALPLLAFVLCATRFLLIVRTFAVNVFIGDQWEFQEATVFHPRSLLAIFRWQLGPHRQGLGGLLHAAIDPWFHWNARSESFVAAGIIIAACALALWLKVRIAGKLTITDTVIPILFLTPVQYEVIVGVTNYAHGPLPLLLLIALALAWTLPESRTRWTAILLLNFLSIYTGFGLLLGIITPLAITLEYFAKRQEPRRHAIAATIALMSLASFFIGYVRNPDAQCFSTELHSPLHYFLFSGFMFSNFLGIKATQELVLAILLGSGSLVLFAGVLMAITRRLQLVPFILLAYSLAFALLTAFGRTCMGLGAAQGSRYMTYLIPALLAVYLFSLSIKDRMAHCALIASTCVLVTISGARIHNADMHAMANLRNGRVEWKACYLAEHDLVRCNRLTGANIYSYPDSIQTKLDILEQRRLNLFAQ